MDKHMRAEWANFLIESQNRTAVEAFGGVSMGREIGRHKSFPDLWT